MGGLRVFVSQLSLPPEDVLTFCFILFQPNYFLVSEQCELFKSYDNKSIMLN